MASRVSATAKILPPAGFIPAQSLRIARSIEPFLVGEHDLGGLRQKADAAHQVESDPPLGLHDCRFFFLVSFRALSRIECGMPTRASASFPLDQVRQISLLWRVWCSEASKYWVVVNQQESLLRH
jgi:hypothetical protein